MKQTPRETWEILFSLWTLLFSFRFCCFLRFQQYMKPDVLNGGWFKWFNQNHQKTGVSIQAFWYFKVKQILWETLYFHFVLFEHFIMDQSRTIKLPSTTHHYHSQPMKGFGLKKKKITLGETITEWFETEH